MILNNLFNTLMSNGIKSTLINDKIYIGESAIYDRFIEADNDGYFTLKVFLTNKQYQSFYSRKEYIDCFQERYSLIREINDKNIGIQFNGDGDSYE